MIEDPFEIVLGTPTRTKVATVINLFSMVLSVSPIVKSGATEPSKVLGDVT